jgi:hypothetical protein
MLHKIKFLCRAIPKVEWSGILLYTVKGSIREPKKMEIVLRDIIPMNKGSQAYTEYSFNEKKRDTSGYEDRMIDYFNDNPKAFEEDWRIGHIHSHNSMNVFFSGTDMSELDDNSASHDFYLSLIVNNWMDFMAKVAFRASVNIEIPAQYQALDEKGNSYVLEDTQLKVKKEKLFIYDCDIRSPKGDKLVVDRTFADSVTDIIDKANKPVTPTYGNYGGYGANTPAKTPTVTPKVTGFTNPANFKSKEKPTDVIRGFVDDIPFADLENMDFDYEEVSDIEEFVISLLRGTNPPDKEVSTVELALEELIALPEEFTPQSLSENIMGNYPVLFEKYFENKAEQDGYFIEVSEEVVNLLEDYEVHYEFLSNTIMALKYMIHKYEEYATTV